MQDVDIENIAKQVDWKCFYNQGYFIIENSFTAKECDQLIKRIDDNITNQTKSNYGNSEHRLWDCEKSWPETEKFVRLSDVLIKQQISNKLNLETVLGIRNRVADESFHTGRWHLDSLNHQYKTFLFLNDVTFDGGAFEFVPYSHKLACKIKGVFKGQYIGFKDFFREKKRKYQKLPDNICDIVNLNPIRLTCSKGTIVLADTSAIHRASPCVNGERYALTAYYI